MSKKLGNRIMTKVTGDADDDSIDFDQLEAQLLSKIDAEEISKLQNDVKIRAISDGTPTYEQFRDRVNAAHLRPLDKKDGDSLTKMPSRVVWNSNANTNKDSKKDKEDVDETDDDAGDVTKDADAEQS